MSISCRICSSKLKIIFNYGEHALSGSFLKNSKNFKSEKKYPLNLCFCENCSHVQIKEIIKPSKLFKNYLWETGVSKTNLNLIEKLILDLKKRKNINKRSRFLEIASNDASFLKKIKSKFKSQVVGVDPAKNFKKIYKKNKITFFCDFFKEKISKKILSREKKFDFIVARNVLAHVPNPNQIFKESKYLLDDDGFFILEFPSLLGIYKGLQYDNVFHEHIGYHSLKSVMDLAKNNKLELCDYEIIDSQGTSLRCFLKHTNQNKIANNKIQAYLYQEKKNKLYNYDTWKSFSKKIKKHSTRLKSYLIKLKKEGKNISVYGASGKGQSLLQLMKINRNIIDYVFDMGKLKIGKFTPGTRIPIISPLKINKVKTDYILLMTWNLKKEILSQNKKFVEKGGKFIIPFPKIHLT